MNVSGKNKLSILSNPKTSALKNCDQVAHSVLMVEPTSFCANPETQSSNAFQKSNSHIHRPQDLALAEFNELANKLIDLGIEVIKFKEPAFANAPDSLFPNNWFANLPNGQVFLFPMQAENRRREVQPTWIEQVFPGIQMQDLRSSLSQEKFLEGTGSMILDHKNKIAYACASVRTNAELLNQFCELSAYRPFLFKAVDGHGQDYYHTNVIMSLGEATAVICLESVQGDQEALADSLRSTGKNLVLISRDQVLQMAGNILRLNSKDGRKFWLGSESAKKSFTADQLRILEAEAEFIAVPVPTIEALGGGSVRCMLAELFFP